MRELFSVRLKTPDGEHSEIEVQTDGTLLVGRDPACDVVLPSPAVSRFHLDIVADSGGLRITDRSSNGMLAGDVRVHHSTAVVPPHVALQVGPYTLQVGVRSSNDRMTDASPELRRRIHRALLDHLDLASLDAAKMDDTTLRPRVVSALERIVASHESRIPSLRARERLQLHRGGGNLAL